MDDLDQINLYLDVVLGTATGIVALGLVSGSNPDHPAAVDRPFFYQWPEDREKVIKLVSRYTDQDVYISPMLYSERHRKAEYVTATPVLWCDGDDADPEGWALQPSLAIETSPDRWHYYWLIDGEVEPVWAARMSRAIAYSRREEGSGYEGWQLSKYLRLPGTTNTRIGKEGDPFKVTVTERGSGELYPPDKLIAAFGEPSKARTIAAPYEAPVPAVLPTKADVLAKMPYDADITRMLQDPPNRPSWNEILWALECRLFRNHNLTAPEVLALVSGCACDKYARDGRPIEHLWVEVLRAEVAAPNWEDPGTIGLITNENEALYTPPPVERTRFLTDDEQARVDSDDSFIDRYRKWAMGRTNADPRYHEYGAMCLMSTILSDFGHAVPKFGNMKLNIWFMILGVTTRTYKTTSRKLMLEILNPLQDPDAGYQYKIGSDATPEALVAKLSTMPKRSVMFYGDEVSKFFADIRGGKGYMSGMGETLTELYDGHVRGRLRSTGTKETPEVETAFNLYLMGVPGKVSQILTHEDFATGFLARFLFVIGEPEPRTRESMYMEQQSEEHSKHDDPIAKQLRTELAQVRYWWSNRTSPGETVPIRVTAAAWQRYNDFIADLLDKAASEVHGEVMEPSADRMNKQVLKLACLFAMMDRLEEVDMRHMLRAIWYAEAWYMSMIQMSELIATSAWSAKVDELVAFVAKKDKSPYTAAYRHFRDMKPKEFQELVQAACDAGLMRQANSPDGRFLSV